MACRLRSNKTVRVMLLPRRMGAERVPIQGSGYAQFGQFESQWVRLPRRNVTIPRPNQAEPACFCRALRCGLVRTAAKSPRSGRIVGGILFADAARDWILRPF